jgi:putative ABC transport system permease protein
MAWIKRLKGLWRRERINRELDEELRYHLDRRVTDSINAGRTPRQAWEDAQKSFGNFTLQKERTRDMDILGWLESFAQDVRYGVRSLVKNPGFAIVAILTLALGIGANTAIFSVVNGVLLKPLPFDHPEEIVWFQDVQPKLSNAPLSAPEFIAYRNQNHTLAQIAAFRIINFTLTGRGPAEQLRGGVVTPQYFPLIRIAPALGRDFTVADGKPGAPRVAILTDGYWKSAFGGDAGAIGQTLALNGESVTIVGVLPKDYVVPGMVSFFMNPKYGVPEVFPGGSDPTAENSGGTHYMLVIGRLKSGATLAQAQTELSSIIADLNKSRSIAADKAHGVRIILWRELWIGNSRSTLFTLLAVVGLVLLIACANVANLLLARSSARTREIAVRAAMGATAWRLGRQLVTEGALLGFLGGVVSLPIAYAGVKGLVAAKPIGIPNIFAIQIDARVLLFTFAISVLAGITFGLAPALRGMRVSAGESLKQAGRSGSGGVRQHWTRSILVISEVALSLVLLAGAGLLVRSFVRLLEVNPGFRPERMMTFALSFSGPKYHDFAHHPERVAQFLQTLDRIKSLPGVEGVASANDIPLDGQDTTSYPRFIGETAVASNQQVLTGMHAVSPGYFNAMGIPLLNGRELSDRDVPGAPVAAVINQAFAQRVWPGQNPIGKQFRLFTADNDQPEQVVGVVANVKHNGLIENDSMDVYESVAQQPWPYAAVAVRTAQGGVAVLPSIRAAMAEYDPDLAVSTVRTMDQITAASLGPRKVTLTLVGLFAVLALVLATIGIYGVMSYIVSGRTQEIGIRIALGAQRADVFKLVVGQGMALAGAGLVLGLIAAAGLTRFLGSQLFHVKAIDPITYCGVTLLLGGVALLACYIPARRATRVDPLVALRYE